MVLVDLFSGQQWRHRCKEETCGHNRGRGWDELRGQYWNIYIAIIKQIAGGMCCVPQGARIPLLGEI